VLGFSFGCGTIADLGALFICGVLALERSTLGSSEPLSIYFSDGAPRSPRAEVHLGDILLWAAVGVVFLAGALALLAV
jgi:hypothetical protein